MGASGFSGQYDHSLDDKGRVSIPVRFREALEPGGDQVLFICKHKLYEQKCLKIYPPGEWNRLLGFIRQKDIFDPSVEMFKTALMGSAHEAELDQQGRILIPPHLREYAGLNREVTFRGALDHFTLWDRAEHAKFELVADQVVIDPGFRQKLRSASQ